MPSKDTIVWIPNKLLLGRSLPSFLCKNNHIISARTLVTARQHVAPARSVSTALLRLFTIKIKIGGSTCNAWQVNKDDADNGTNDVAKSKTMLTVLLW